MDRTPEQLVDDALVVDAQNGDRDAFDKLVKRWQSRLWRHAFRLTQRKEAASDVIQEAWIAMYRNLPTLEDPQRFRQWSYRIVTNKCSDWTRQQLRTRKVVENSAVDIEEAPEPTQDESNDNIGAVRSALDRMTNDRRTILAMLYHDGMSLQEIAEVMDIPIGTVKSRLHSARVELRDMLRHLNAES